MDGAGSLTRSLFRSLRPQADLKAAAIGAVVLLREWLQDKRDEKRAAAKVKSRAKAIVEREPPPRVVALIERYLPRRVGISMTVLLLIGSCGFGIVKGGHLQDFITAVSDARNALANSAGFRITSVVINGRKQLTQDEILAIGGVSGRSSLLFLDADAVRDKLKANPWIADATVLKLYPGQLMIELTERKAFALWQEAGRLSVIADDGAVLDADYGTSEQHLVGAEEIAAQAVLSARLAAHSTPVLLGGRPGVAAVLSGSVVSVMAFEIEDDRIVRLDVLADPARLADLGVARVLDLA